MHGDDVQVSVTAKDLDGSVVSFTLERLDGKKWVEAGTSKATVKGGKATAKITLSHPGAHRGRPPPPISRRTGSGSAPRWWAPRP